MLNKLLSRFRAAQPPLASAATPFTSTGLLHAARRVLDKREAFYTQLVERVQQRTRQDVQRWRTALIAAEYPDRPNRRYLLEIYEELLLDAHVRSLLATRRLRVLGSPCYLYNLDGSVNHALTALLRQPWFTDLVGYVLDSLFYGHSLVELVQQPDGQLQAELIPRPNVSPELGLVTLDARLPLPGRSDLPAVWDGWYPIAALPYALISAGGTRNLGLLNPAVPLVLYKRNALNCWSEFVEVFGMPVRIGRTAARDERRKQELAQVLKDMGSAAYAVLEQGEDLELREHTKGDAYNVYDKLIDRTNHELSKLINGQTLTVEADDRGARALGEIHEKIFAQITRSDVRLVEAVVQTQVLPLLARFTAYQVASSGYRFGYDLDEAILSLKEQWQIDQGLLAHFEIDPDYFRQKYSVPITATKRTPNFPNS